MNFFYLVEQTLELVKIFAVRYFIHGFCKNEAKRGDNNHDYQE